MAEGKILIADSGSTKTDWLLMEKGRVVHKVKTDGINPFLMTQSAIVELLTDNLIPNLPDTALDSLYFYGAGCRDEKIEMLRAALSDVFTVREVFVYSDMMAAARALCGNKRGIACILGTGANSCLYDGERIVKSISPLGFILGDEGSGASLGKRLVADACKGLMPEDLRKVFTEEYKIDVATVLDRVYKQPFPNRYLASFAPFLKQHEADDYVDNLLCTAFADFFVRNILPYGEPSFSVNIVGGIAHHFEKQIRKVGNNLGISVGEIRQTPAEGLVEYHLFCNFAP